MNNVARHSGTVMYSLWGLIHIAGGFIMMSQPGALGVAEALTGSGNGGPVPGIVDGIVRYHSFNLFVLGLAVLIVALILNRTNSRTGYWLNLALAGIADIGLILFLIIPGHLTFADGSPGIILFILGALFTTISIRNND